MGMPRGRPGVGVTLVELAITLVVLAILAVIAVPSISARLERQRLESAAHTLAADLSNTRFEAVQQGRALHLSFGGTPAWCWAVSAAQGCACGTANACQLRRVQAADFASIRLHALRDVTVGADGRPEPGRVATLESSRGDRLQVDLAPLGRTRVCAERGRFSQIPAC